MNAITALMLIVAGQDAAVPAKAETTKVETKESEAANAPLSPSFEHYFKNADDNKLDLTRQSGYRTRELNASFARSSPQGKTKIKAEIELEKMNLAAHEAAQGRYWPNAGIVSPLCD